MAEEPENEMTSFINDKTDDQKNPERNHSGDVVIGVVASQVSLICSSGSTACVQLLEGAIPDLELNSMRASFPLLLNSTILLLKRKWPTIPRKAWMWTGLVIVLDWIETIGKYASVNFIPMSVMASVSLTVQLLFTLFASKLFLNEDIKLVNIASILLCICGVVLILQPYDTEEVHPINQSELNSSYNSTCEWPVLQPHNNRSNISKGSKGIISELEDTSNGLTANYPIGCLIAANAGLLSVAYIIAMKKLSAIEDYSNDILVVNFWLYLFHFISSFILSAIFEHPVVPATSRQYLWICLHGLCYTFVCPTIFLTTEKLTANVATILFSLELVYMLVLQYSFMQDIMPGHRNWQEVLGVLCTLLGATLSTLWLYIRK